MVERVPDVVCELHARKIQSDFILEPSRVVATTSQQVRIFINFQSMQLNESSLLEISF